MSKKIVIIGGVAGGASTAARLRRVDEDAQIIMLERGPYISFANCGLPYHIGNTITDRDELLLQTPESMKTRFNIDVRVENEVTRIDRDAKLVEIRNLLTGETYTETYDTLVLSPGSSPIRPRIPGLDSPGVFSLWNMNDMDQIIAKIKALSEAKGLHSKLYIDNLIGDEKTAHPLSAIVVGGGFIGLEMVENLHHLGMNVKLVEMADQVMAPIDFDMAQLVHSELVEKGVELYLKNGVSEFEQRGDDVYVKLQSGETLVADLVIFSIGIRPNSELAKDAGLTLNERGGIVVDDHMQTNDPNIYALGDAVEVVDYVNGNKTMIPLAGPANKQGRIVANNIAGIDDHYIGTMGTSIAKIFGMTVASTGTNEKILNRLGKVYKKDYFVSVIRPNSHAGYYPGATQMTLKTIYDAQGKVLGAQAVGIDGVDKRIDVIATVIKLHGTIYDLRDLELAYAPPYSSAKDPVNMAGFTAENALTGQMDGIMWHEIKNLDLESVTLLDVRTPGENKHGTIAGSFLLPVDSLRDNMELLDPSKETVIFCAVGIRGYIAGKILKQNGFNVHNLMGGYGFYEMVMKNYSK